MLTNGVMLTMVQQLAFRTIAVAQTSTFEVAAKAQRTLSQYERTMGQAVTQSV
jgi:hypothetical protein